MQINIIIITKQKNKTGLILFNYDIHSLPKFKLTGRDVLKLLIIKCQMPIKSFGYLLCMYIWLQREALCVYFNSK